MRGCFVREGWIGRGVRRSHGVVVVAAMGCSADSADWVVENGSIHVGPDQTVEALALRDGHVVALGEDALHFRAEQRLDLQRGVVYPGFQDAHVHLLAGSFALERLLLLGVSSMNAMASASAEYAATVPDEPWIVGYGWLSENIDGPTGAPITERIPDRPVLLMSNSGHEAIVNQAALAAAGITALTPDPPGGTIVRDSVTGEPTGYLVESAVALVADLVLEAYDDAALSSALEQRLEEFSAAGLTGVAEILAVPGFDIGRPWIYSNLEDAGRLPMRVTYYLPVFSSSDVVSVAEECAAHAGDLVRCGGAKVWVDGSMGGAEAWVEDPYENEAGTFGSSYFSAEALTELVREAERVGLPLKLHVNGDAAVGAALEALEAVAVESGLAQRHVLDHVVLLDAEDYARMERLDVVASVQPTHFVAAQFGETASLLGERFDHAYDFRGLADAGVPLALGTDWPVWPSAQPLLVAWNTAMLPPERGLTLKEAWWAHIQGPAASVGRESDLGCLTEGCAADFVVLGEDPLEIPLEAVPDVPIREVWVAGTRVR